MSEPEYLKLKNALDSNKTGLRHIDCNVLVDMFGYKDVDDYYRQVSLAGRLDQIAVPTLALHSWDDQMIGPHTVPVEEITSRGSNIILATTPKGAHCCHLAGKITPKPFYWKPFLQFFKFLESKKMESDCDLVKNNSNQVKMDEIYETKKKK